MASELQNGQRVGPYRLLFRLGKGGMGEVWAAQKAAVFGFERLVALKLLRGVASDSNAAVMFFDEARAAAALNHAAIVPTTDLGQYGDTFYIAMGMVRGPSLTALLQRLAVLKRPVPPAIVAYIGERIASALDYAYERAEIDGKKLRLIHRDISPHNVLIDEEGNVMLSDFGVARTDAQEHESRVGTVRGKPSYMAPEQVRAGHMDARTDIFALGIVLYEAACVKRLFGRSNPVKSMDAVVSYEPKPLETMVPGFPPALWGIISRSLAKGPEDRFANAAEMARALGDVNRALPGAPTAARDLADLIREVFPANSFNVDERVKEAMSQAQGTVSGEEVAEGEPQEATAYEPTPRRAVAAFAEPVGTSAWPTAQAGADPLDPDALADLQAQMAANRLPAMFSNTNSGSIPGFQGGSYPNVTGTVATHRSGRGSKVAVLSVVALALIALLAVGATLLKPSEPTLAYEEPAPVEEELVIGATPVPMATAPKVLPAASPAERPHPVATASPHPAAPLLSPSPTPAAEPARRPSSPRPSARPVESPSEAPAPPRAVLTPESVLALINAIPDKTRASALRVALAEAGSNDANLARVRDAAIEAAKAH